MRLGFVINPLAGIGGTVALKGSDGEDIVELALSRGASLKAEKRASVALQEISQQAVTNDIVIFTAAGSMGENVLTSHDFPCKVIYEAGEHTTPVDTKNVIRLFVEQGVDLIVFAGGDGTARDVLDAMNEPGSDELKSLIPVIGIPAGVKIHSAVMP